MTDEHGSGASLDQGTVVDDQGRHREAAVARAAMVAVAGAAVAAQEGRALARVRQGGAGATWARWCSGYGSSGLGSSRWWRRLRETDGWGGGGGGGGGDDMNSKMLPSSSFYKGAGKPKSHWTVSLV